MSFQGDLEEYFGEYYEDSEAIDKIAEDMAAAFINDDRFLQCVGQVSLKSAIKLAYYFGVKDGMEE